jgi:ABC-type sugar transport system permease subunit
MEIVLASPPARHHGPMSAKDRFVLASLLPVFILFTLFVVVPIGSSVVISLFNYNPLGRNPPFVGLRNYLNAVTDPVVLASMRNTLCFVSVSVAVNIVIAILVALAIESVGRRGIKDLFRTIYFLPTTANIAAVAIVWGFMLEPDFGIVAFLLGRLGVSTRLFWFANPSLVLPSIITLNLWQDIGYNIIILLAGLQSIPRTFYENAVMDGARPVQIFFRVTLPLMSRTMTFVSVMTVISYFQVFTPVMVLTRGGPDHASELFGVMIYLNAFQYAKMGYASALAVILMVIMMGLSLLQMRLARSDWEY